MSIFIKNYNSELNYNSIINNFNNPTIIRNIVELSKLIVIEIFTIIFNNFLLCTFESKKNPNSSFFTMNPIFIAFSFSIPN